MKTYVLIKITNFKIELLREVKEHERLEVQKTKNPGEIIWSVKSYQDAVDQINKHNGDIQKARVTQPKPTPITTYPLWDFEKISEKTKKEILKYYEQKNWGAIMIIHNDLKLSAAYYCCDSYIPYIEYNIKQWIG